MISANKAYEISTNQYQMTEDDWTLRKIEDTILSTIFCGNQRFITWHKDSINSNVIQMLKDNDYFVTQKEDLFEISWDFDINFNSEHAKYFEEVEFIVEATSFERFAIWEKHFKDGSIPYVQVNEGVLLEIGKINNNPVCVQLNYAIINNKKIMFYEACSTFVDFEMVEEWINHFGANIKYDSGYRRAHCNAMNFGHCLAFIRQ